MKKISAGAKSAVVYTLSTIFSRGLAIISVPIFTRLMTSEQIGIVNIYSSWYSLISVIATLSLISGGFNVAMKEFENERDQYLSSVLSLTSGISLIISAVLIAFSDYWTSVLGLSKRMLLLMSIGFLVAPARDFWLARQRYEYKYKLAGLVTIVSAIVATAVSIISVYSYSRQKLNNFSVAEVRLLSNYIVIYGVAIVIWISIFLKGKTLFKKKYWKLSLSLSLPLVGYQIASQILSTSDRLMISKLVNDSAVGIYSTLYTVSSLSLMVWSALNSSFVPFLFQNINSGNQKIKKISFSMLAFFSLVAVELVYLAPEIVRFIATEEYYEAIWIMPPIAAGVYFISVSNLYSNVLTYLKKTKYIMFSSIIAAVSNIILNYIFIRIYGYMAAAYTTLASYVIMTALLMIFAIKTGTKCGVSVASFYSNKMIVTMSVVTVFLCMIGLPLYNLSLLRLVLAIILFLSLLVMVLIKQKK
ncbi:MAG: oligosaccharide flippase family protein [Clostridia bacterium]|nr:oligosaccharide flippase family protein [Clostridia bacterium]